MDLVLSRKDMKMKQQLARFQHFVSPHFSPHKFHLEFSFLTLFWASPRNTEGCYVLVFPARHPHQPLQNPTVPLRLACMSPTHLKSQVPCLNFHCAQLPPGIARQSLCTLTRWMGTRTTPKIIFSRWIIMCTWRNPLVHSRKEMKKFFSLKFHRQDQLNIDTQVQLLCNGVPMFTFSSWAERNIQQSASLYCTYTHQFNSPSFSCWRNSVSSFTRMSVWASPNEVQRVRENAGSAAPSSLRRSTGRLSTFWMKSGSCCRSCTRNMREKSGLQIRATWTTRRWRTTWTSCRINTPRATAPYPTVPLLLTVIMTPQIKLHVEK